jgi:hypothetical protein
MRSVKLAEPARLPARRPATVASEDQLALSRMPLPPAIRPVPAVNAGLVLDVARDKSRTQAPLPSPPILWVRSSFSLVVYPVRAGPRVT